MDSDDVKDQMLKCHDCGDIFVWLAGEQRFYKSKGLAVPKRCFRCRQRRKATINPESGVK